MRMTRPCRRSSAARSAASSAGVEDSPSERPMAAQLALRGGGTAVAANIRVDLTKPTTDLAGMQGFTLECDADEAKRRLDMVRDAGFDLIVLVVNEASEENLTAIRALAE